MLYTGNHAQNSFKNYNMIHFIHDNFNYIPHTHTQVYHRQMANRSGYLAKTQTHHNNYNIIVVVQ